MEIWKIILIIVGGAAIVTAAYFIFKSFSKGESNMRHLPIRIFGYKEMPAVPFSIIQTIETLVKLGLRKQQVKMPTQGLTNTYTLGGETREALAFMYDTADTDPHQVEREALLHRLMNSNETLYLAESMLKRSFDTAAHKKNVVAANSLTEKFLEEPEQFAMSWTNYGGLANANEKNTKVYASALREADEASKQFWPMIAEQGVAYNLLILQKVGAEKQAELQALFAAVWGEIEVIHAQGNLFVIDLSIFSKWESSQVKNFDRWTPGSIVLLEQNPTTKELTPIAIRVSGKIAMDAKIFTRIQGSVNNSTDSAWIWAIMAARTSVTVFGIWIGHVYHYHIVSAPMQMTMFNEVSDKHAIRQLLDPQSKSLIGFDAVLLLLWSSIGPPTSFSTPELFLDLTNTYATGRNFFDDDPKVTLAKFGITQEDFTVDKPWDRFPNAGRLLHFWELSENFASAFVSSTYASNQEVANDVELQNWIAKASDPENGNVRGLPKMDSLENLTSVLSSLIYRVFAHGSSRQQNTISPELAFVSNFPPCLQDPRIPGPEEKLELKQLLRYMPNTGTIGEMIAFYYIFIYSAPYVPLIPLFGSHQDLYFPGGATEPRNAALIDFRNALDAFVHEYDPTSPLVHQWPASIET